MNEVTNMPIEQVRVLLGLFTVLGAIFGCFMGFVLGRVGQATPRVRKPRRTPEQRHTRSHW